MTETNGNLLCRVSILLNRLISKIMCYTIFSGSITCQFFFLLVMDDHKGTEYWQILPLENNRRKRSCSNLREKEMYFGNEVAKIQ